MDALTPLPQVSCPPETPQLPLEVDIVKLLAEPEKVYVASVWTDHVPLVSSPPVVLAWIVPLLGKLPGLCAGLCQRIVCHMSKHEVRRTPVGPVPLP